MVVDALEEWGPSNICEIAWCLLHDEYVFLFAPSVFYLCVINLPFVQDYIYGKY